MIDQRILRDNPEILRISQRKRGADPAIVDELIALDQDRRSLRSDFEAKRAEQKQLGKKIGPLQRAAKTTQGADREAAQAELQQLLQHAADLSESVKAADAAATELEAQLSQKWLTIDNLVDDASPVGDEDAFTLLETVGTPRDFAAEGFPPQDHLAVGARLGAIDVERAAKVSGSRFFYLLGDGALLELALLNLAMSLASKHGLTPVLPPALVGPEAMSGTGFLGQAAENVYQLPQDDLYLVGTAEVPLAAMHSDEILDEAALPIRYAGYSPCFRREAGSHGKDTRGIIRVHQFDKVEMFVFCTPEQAAAEHERLLGWEKEFLNLLEIPYRVIDVATGDLGASAARKFDIEAWIPTQERYREVTSASNCTSFQARRLKIRYRDSHGTPTPVATLNGTLVAMPRVIVAILENHQNSDGSVDIPSALQPFLGGRSQLTPPESPGAPHGAT
ncbi:MAG: serine--tRNA ligase [Actinomycetia bacterium]|nr:serine--tRNA ligase [Actinomycetes bacterium]